MQSQGLNLNKHEHICFVFVKTLNHVKSWNVQKAKVIKKFGIRTYITHKYQSEISIINIHANWFKTHFYLWKIHVYQYIYMRIQISYPPPSTENSYTLNLLSKITENRPSSSGRQTKLSLGRPKPPQDFSVVIFILLKILRCKNPASNTIIIISYYILNEWINRWWIKKVSNG